jgi:diguanylate cyclase (GGDEF)-like protein
VAADDARVAKSKGQRRPLEVVARVTASFGVASMPEDGPDGAALLRQADRALYRAKELGRNRVEGLTQPFSSRA